MYEAENTSTMSYEEFITAFESCTPLAKNVLAILTVHVAEEYHAGVEYIASNCIKPESLRPIKKTKKFLLFKITTDVPQKVIYNSPEEVTIALNELISKGLATSFPSERAQNELRYKIIFPYNKYIKQYQRDLSGDQNTEL